MKVIRENGLSRHLLIVCVALTVLACRIAMAQDPCVVTAPDGDGEGTLPYAAFHCAGTITFQDVGEVVLIDRVILRNDSVAIDGAGAVTIRGEFEKPLIYTSRDDVAIRDIRLDHAGPVCFKTTGYANVIEGVDLLNCSTGIAISSDWAFSNLVRAMTFENVVMPIDLMNGANEDIAAPSNLVAEEIDGTRWNLSGSSLAADTVEIDVYSTNGDSIAYEMTLTLDDIVASAPDFSAVFTNAELPRDHDYRLVFIDMRDNTSEFSDVVTPPVLPGDGAPPPSDEGDDDDDATGSGSQPPPPGGGTGDEPDGDDDGGPDSSESAGESGGGGCSVAPHGTSSASIPGMILVAIALALVALPKFAPRPA